MKVMKRFGDIRKTVAEEVTHQYKLHYWRKAEQERFEKTQTYPKGGEIVVGYCRGKAALDAKIAKLIEGAKAGIRYRANEPQKVEPYTDVELFVTITEATEA